ncbi:MAG: hypothetical protein U0361_04915 [Nitrospiraceae bacterium]
MLNSAMLLFSRFGGLLGLHRPQFLIDGFPNWTRIDFEVAPEGVDLGVFLSDRLTRLLQILLRLPECFVGTLSIHGLALHRLRGRGSLPAVTRLRW